MLLSRPFRNIVAALVLIVSIFSKSAVSRGQSNAQSHQSATASDANSKQTTANCANSGTYVNSKGETVKRPENCSSAPEGATAQCRDGTYSFSRSHRGTCSHHGGVAKWL
jgi:Protein of unknown function (DUF3761)